MSLVRSRVFYAYVQSISKLISTVSEYNAIAKSAFTYLLLLFVQTTSVQSQLFVFRFLRRGSNLTLRLRI